jgi:hypothetical protein
VDQQSALQNVTSVDRKENGEETRGKRLNTQHSMHFRGVNSHTMKTTENTKEKEEEKKEGVFSSRLEWGEGPRRSV